VTDAAQSDWFTDRLKVLLEVGLGVASANDADELGRAIASNYARVLGVDEVVLHRHDEVADCFEEASGTCVKDGRAFAPIRSPRGDLVAVVEAPVPDDLELMSVLAGYAGMALTVYEERRAGLRRNAALQRLLELSSSARETLEPEPVLEEICAVAEALLGFQDVEIALLRDSAYAVVAGGPGRLDGFSKDDGLALLNAGSPRQGCLVMPDDSVALELLDRRGGLSGLMYARQGTGERRSSEAFRLLRTFADQAAAALDSAAQEAVREERDRARWLAKHDELTGLPNRAQAMQRLAEACIEAGRNNTAVVAVLIDLEGFAIVNDSLGVEAGDSLLHAVGTNLAAVAEEGETVARVGGDEFLLVAPAAHGGVAAIAKRVHAALAKPVEIKDMQLQVAATLGVALAPLGEVPAPEILRRAEAAVKRAKSNGDAISISGGGHDSRRQLTLTSALRGALERDEFKLHYQPLMSVETGEVASYEALLRWFPRDGDPVSPGEFIPLAETSGLIEEIGAWVINEACRQKAEWIINGFGDVHVGVNVAPRQFRRTDVPGIVAAALREFSLEPGGLTVEVTESGLQTGSGALEKELIRLREMGVPVGIDDFGTDYSSLSRLNRLPVEWLKIDRSFMRDVPDDPRAARLVAAILGIAEALEMKTVAEGIEHLAQEEFIRRAGGTMMQGFLYSPPVPPERAIALMTSLRPSAESAPASSLR
jgi:diguanylate cyclase (GGDEF)-like protein